ncbi:MBL fold metallo-hydrolase [Demetria terragena]|uniref:MBL fold metallo-hydrolase n=1 Tax=Demetria terragena TaxID=63959 RepID=UPI00036F0179|nr:MBL fold metallo-hydrolase [Demetria terragena]
MAETVREQDGVRVDRVVTSGTFSLDGGTWEVDNNVWVIGNDTECLVIDAAHDAEAIMAAVGDRSLVAVVCTHAHDDHINQVGALKEAAGAPTYLHPEDRVLWDQFYAEAAPDQDLSDGQEIEVAGTRLRVLHTPGHAPGACCLYAPDLGAVFTGDTLFQGGPGATGRSFSDYPTIVDSIDAKLLALPEETVVFTGHGDATSIGAEAAGRAGWSAPD